MTREVLGVDVGGTFTDFTYVQNGLLKVLKLPSSAKNAAQVVLDGMAKLGVSDNADISHGSTIATNTLLERKGARTALVITQGFEDILEIGRQNRHSIYNLDLKKMPSLIPNELLIGIKERISSDGKILTPLESEDVQQIADVLKNEGVEAIAVSLLFSFLNSHHEKIVKDILLKTLHDQNIFLSISSELLPEYREYERTSTIAVNAYLGPIVNSYLKDLTSKLGRQIRIMHSGGGSLSATRAAMEPVRTLLSGPAGGVAGAFQVAKQAGFDHIITLDMGGTSTDVSICPGMIQETNSARLGGYSINSSMIDIHTVGAGGGSIARLDTGGALLVGPESAGSDPGPVCYGFGNDITVTDANLVTGRLDPDQQLGGGIKLDLQRSRTFMSTLAETMQSDMLTIAEGIIEVVNSNMEKALRAISLERGYDPRQFTLMAFGGAGPMHACSLAEQLGIPNVLIPAYPGVLSSIGIATSNVVKDYSRTVLLKDDTTVQGQLEETFKFMKCRGLEELAEEGFTKKQIHIEHSLDIRYVGQSYELNIPCSRPGKNFVRSVKQRFHTTHKKRYGHMTKDQPIEIVTARLKVIGYIEHQNLIAMPMESAAIIATEKEQTVVFDGISVETKCYRRDLLTKGHTLNGPILILQMDTTTVIPPGWTLRVDYLGNLIASTQREDIS